MNQYSLVHLTCAEIAPPDLIRYAAAAGFDCVSLRGIPTRTNEEVLSVSQSRTGFRPFALADDPVLRRETRQAAETEGIILNDVENARIFEGVDVRNYERDLESAAELGIRHVLTNIWVNDPGFYQEQFCRLCELAAGYDIDINLELVTWSAIPGIREAAELLRKANCPNQGIVLDTIHFYRSGNRPKDLAGLPSEWFRYVHLCDAPAEIPQGSELIRTGLEERLIPGEGAIDFRGILKALPPVVRGIEVPHKERLAKFGIQEYLTQALKATKSYLEEKV